MRGASVRVPFFSNDCFSFSHLFMAVDALLIDAFGPLLHRATGQAVMGASALLRRAAASELDVVVTDLRGAGNVEEAIASAGVDVPGDVALVPAEAAASPERRIAVVAEQRTVHPSQCAAVVSTPWAAFAAVEAGATAVAVAKASAAESLQQSGARARYATAKALADDLDAALARCGPQAVSLTPARLAGWMEEAVDAARRGMDAGEIPIGSTLVSRNGETLGAGHNEARSTGRPTAHAEMQAIADAARRHSLKTHDGLVLVTTMEPCAMCFGAALEIGIDAIVFAVEAPENGAVGRCTPNRGPGDVHPRAVGGIGRAESLKALQSWADANPGGGFVHRLLDSVKA
jgi:tRNA(Arg) A34 adenosine deaminase TadA